MKRIIFITLYAVDTEYSSSLSVPILLPTGKKIRRFFSSKVTMVDADDARRHRYKGGINPQWFKNKRTSRRFVTLIVNLSLTTIRL